MAAVPAAQPAAQAVGADGSSGTGNGTGSAAEATAADTLPPNTDPHLAIQNIQAAMLRLNQQWSAVAQQPDTPAKQQTQQHLATQLKRLQLVRNSAYQALSPAQQQHQQQQQHHHQQHHHQQHPQQQAAAALSTLIATTMMPSREQFVTMVRQFHHQRNSRLPTNASMTFYGPSTANPHDPITIDAQTIFQSIVHAGGSARLSSVPRAWDYLASAKLGLAVSPPINTASAPPGSQEAAAQAASQSELPPLTDRDGNRVEIELAGFEAGSGPPPHPHLVQPEHVGQRLREWFKPRLGAFEEMWMLSLRQRQHQAQAQAQAQAAMQQQQQQQQQQKQGAGTNTDHPQDQQQQNQQQQQQQQQQGQPSADPTSAIYASRLASIQSAIAQGRITQEEARLRIEALNAEAAAAASRQHRASAEDASAAAAAAAADVNGRPQALGYPRHNQPDSSHPASAPVPTPTSTSHPQITASSSSTAAQQMPPPPNPTQIRQAMLLLTSLQQTAPNLAQRTGEQTQQALVANAVLRAASLHYQAQQQQAGQAQGQAQQGMGGMNMGQGMGMGVQGRGMVVQQQQQGQGQGQSQLQQQQGEAEGTTGMNAESVNGNGNGSASGSGASSGLPSAQAQAQAQVQQTIGPSASTSAPPPVVGPPASTAQQPQAGPSSSTSTSTSRPPTARSAATATTAPAPPPSGASNTTKYRIEYMPIRRELKSAGGWDLDMIHDFLAPVLEGRGKAPRGILSSGNGFVVAQPAPPPPPLRNPHYPPHHHQHQQHGQQVVDFELDLGRCGDLVDELVELLGECAEFAPEGSYPQRRTGADVRNGGAGPSSSSSSSSSLMPNGLAAGAPADHHPENGASSSRQERRRDREGGGTGRGETICSHADWIEAAREHEFAMKEWKRRRRSSSGEDDDVPSLDADPRIGGRRLPDGSLPCTTTVSSALEWEARADRAVSLTFTILNIFQNFSTMEVNQVFLARHALFLDRLAGLTRADEGRIEGWKGARRAAGFGRVGEEEEGVGEMNGGVNGRSGAVGDDSQSSMDVDDDVSGRPRGRGLEKTPTDAAHLNKTHPEPPPTTIFTPAELLRIRKEVLYIITNITSGPDPPHILVTRPASTIQALFDLMNLFIADAAHFEDVALAQTEPILGPLNPDAVHLVVQMGISEAIAVAAARSSRRVPQFADLALEAFSRIAQPDEHRALLGRHVSAGSLVRLGTGLVTLLPVSELDFGALQAEARLAFVERTALSLFNLACACPRAVKKSWLDAQPGTLGILWRLVRRLSGAHPTFNTNPFNVLVGRIVETMMILGDVDDRFGAAGLLGISSDGVGAVSLPGGPSLGMMMRGRGFGRGGGGAGRDHDFNLDDDDGLNINSNIPHLSLLSSPRLLSAALGKATSSAERASKNYAGARLGRRDREGPCLMGLEQEVAQVCSLPGMEDWIITNLLSMTGPGGL
ncbi:unnamed protein product [Tilletia caries]|uniref:ARID domain-containing protein n=1 Tax=Tilletia caries TaxID=13290 RepID=A0ABN7IUF3_9BASI|nr:unnamed protein product [Tilletia caries]